MTITRNAQQQRWFAPLSPALLVAIDPGVGPIITEVTPQVATWAGRPSRELIGRPLAAVFGRRLPSLLSIVHEVNDTGKPVRNYRATLRDSAGGERVLLIQAGFRPAAGPHGHDVVALQIEEQTAGQHGAGSSEDCQELHGMFGRSPALLAIFRKIERYGPTSAPVLITGETGTGKELVARALHACSLRRHKPFLAVNCAALSEELLESELFGHERGAFTGAVRMHQGRFERAQGGTLFLDEIGDMPLRLQVKLLRVLEAEVIERVGGEQEVPIDVRFEAATNVSLERAIQTGAFRPDLYHRLAVLRLHMPSLRERPEDLPILVTHFLRLLNQKYRRDIHQVTPEALALLAQYPWPGNIRELRNVLERVYIETTEDVIGPQALEEWAYEQTQYASGTWHGPTSQDVAPPPALLALPPFRSYPALPTSTHATPETAATIDIAPTAFMYLSSPSAEPPPSRLPTLTRQQIAQAYRQARGNVAAAARLLGVHRATLYRRMKALQLSREELATSLPEPM